MKQFRAPLLSLLVVGVLGACAAPEPYLHNPALYDRNHEDFNKPMSDTGQVRVCYAAWGDDPRDRVFEIAKDACGAHDKVAYFVGRSIRTCPALTPVAAVFACALPGDVINVNDILPR